MNARCRGRPAAGRIVRAGATLTMLAWVWGCSTQSGSGLPAAAPPPTVSPTPTPCVPDLGPDATERAREAVFAAQLALADGLRLDEALEAVFGMPISAMTATDRADALRVLAGLDLCPRQSAAVRDEIAPLIHRIAEQGRGRTQGGLAGQQEDPR